MSNNLVGNKVIIPSNEFVGHEQQAIIVTVDTAANVILLNLKMPFESMGTTYSHIVASPRLSRDDLGTLQNDGVISCSLTWVPDSKFCSQNPMDLTWWRGGAAVISDLVLIGCYK